MLRKIARLMFLCLIMFFTTPVLASAAPTFSLNPKGGYIAEGEEFVIDILIDSDGEEIMKAKAVLTFDPTLVKIQKAERNNALFEQYPADEQTTDNTNGVLMLTGFTQSGSSYDLYKTSGAADVFARITFKSLYDGKLTFDWEYSGSDAPFKSVIMKDGSPPQNALSGKPSSVSFTIQDSTGDGTGNSTPPPTIPNTGITDNLQTIWGLVGIFGGILVSVGTSIILAIRKSLRRASLRTVVELE